jgi:hypothetical protein
METLALAASVFVVANEKRGSVALPCHSSFDVTESKKMAGRYAGAANGRKVLCHFDTRAVTKAAESSRAGDDPVD